MTTLENKQLSLIGINGYSVPQKFGEPKSAQPDDIHTPTAGTDRTPVPAPKLPEGWHDTEKYGPVFVSPGGIAWAVQLVGSKFENIAVKITKKDITGKPSAERIKHAAAEKRRYNLAKSSRKQPLQPLQQAPAMENRVSEASIDEN